MVVSSLGGLVGPDLSVSVALCSGMACDEFPNLDAVAVLAAIEQIGVGDLAGRFSAESIGMGFDGLSFFPVGSDGRQLDVCLAYFASSWCGDDFTDGRLRVYVNTADDIGDDRLDDGFPMWDAPVDEIARWVIGQAWEVRGLWPDAPGALSSVV